MSGKIEQHGTQAVTRQEICKRAHEGSFARPSMHQQSASLGLNDVGLHLADAGRYSL
jgi:hypothetical protein